MTPDQSTTRQLIRALSRRQAMSAMALVCFAAGTLFAFWLNLANAERNAETINLAGRQRMLSQRITLYANRFLVETDAERKSVFRGLVEKHVGEFELGHDRLQQKAVQLSTDAEFQELYFGASGRLDETSRLFVEFARHIIADGTSTLEQRELSRDRIQRMADTTLIRPLDEATALFQKKAERQAATLWWIMLASTLLTISAVLFGTVRVFRPMVRKLSSDLALRDRASSALRSSEEKFRNFSAASSDWLWETDAENRFTWLEGSRQTGIPFSPDDILGRTRHELSTPSDASDAAKWQLHQQDLDARRPFRDFEYLLRLADGSSRWLSVNGQPFFAADGSFLGYRGTGHDVHDAKKTEATLQLLSLAIEQSPVSVVITDAEARIIYVNRHFCTLTGYSSAEAIGQNPRLIKSEANPPRLYEALWEALRNGLTWRGELCNRKKSGDLYWERVSISPVRDAQGVATHYVAVKEDITEKRLADMRAQERRLVLERIAHGAGVYDVIAQIAQMIDSELPGAVCSVHGVNHEGTCLTHLYAPELSAHFIESTSHLDILEGHGCPSTAAYRKRRVIAEDIENHPYWAPLRSLTESEGLKACWSEPILASDRQLLGVFSCYFRQAATPSERDLNALEMAAGLAAISIEKAVAERALSDSEAMKRSIVAAAMDAIVTIDAQGETIDFNPAAEKIFGFRREETLGRPISDLIIPARYRDAHRRGLQRHARTGDGNVLGRRIELPAIDASGREFPIEISITHHPGMHVYVAFIRDLTEQKKTEESLRRTQKLQAMGQLTGGIAHDFNNLLGIIQGNLELLKRAFPDNEAGAKRIETALKSTRRGAELTRRLLMFARQDSGAAPAAPAQLNELLEGMLDVLRRTLTSKIEVVPKFAPGLWTVSVNAGELEDCIVNLAINARDAMSAGGRLTLRTENVRLQDAIEHIGPEAPLGDYVLLSISDNGCGIPKDVIGHIFEPFFSTKERGKGTGLGLAMVYGAVRRAGGFINVYSEPGTGTTFRIYLPKSELTVSPPTEAQLIGPPHGSGTVLVVDDEPMLLDVAQGFLEDLGYQAILANSASEALALLAQNPQVDIVVSDIVMPGEMDGVELARRILAGAAKAKVILASGYSEYDNREIAEEDLRKIVGNILTKPYSKRQLAEMLHQALATA